MNTERECPSCHRVNRSGAVMCEGCGSSLITGRPGRGRTAARESHPGVLGLALGTVVHPVRTMDSFFYYVQDMSMVGKMAVFYLLSLPISGFITAAGRENASWAQGMVAEAAGFAVSTLCIVLAGRILGQPGSLLGTAAILGFTRAVVTFVSGLYLVAIVIDLMNPSFLVLLIFMIWSIVLNIMALTNVFGCSASVAFLISIIAGFLHSYVLRAMGVSG